MTAKKKNVPLKKVAERKAEERKATVYPKVRIFSDMILTTSKSQTMTEQGIYLADKKGNILTTQEVVCAGPHATVKVGEFVEIDPEKFAVKRTEPKHGIGPDNKKIQVPLESIDGEVYLMLTARHLKFVYDPTVEDPK